MAGKNQHHIWQMLQRGFSLKEHNDNHIWVYRNSAAPERTVTRIFGQQSSFYGPRGSEADENITKFENATQGFIQDARKMENGQSIDGDIAAGLVAHLEMRSLFFRDEISRLGERIARFVRDSITDPKKYQEIMSAYIKNHPDLLDAEMDKASIDGSMQPLIRDLVMQAAPQLIRDSAPEMAMFAGLFYDKMAAAMTETAKSAHNKSLLADFSEVNRADSHRSLKFSILRSSHADFILPDTSLAFFTRTRCTPISDKDERVEAVIVPLSTDVAILGRQNSSFQRGMQTIQRALAGCAYEAFLSPQRRDDLVKLSRRISKNARLLTEADIRSVFRADSLLKI